MFEIMNWALPEMMVALRTAAAPGPIPHLEPRTPQASPIGMYESAIGVAAAMNGFLFKKLEWPFRVLICIGGLLMMDPTAITDVIGIVLFAAVFAWQYFGAKKERAAA